MSDPRSPNLNDKLEVKQWIEDHDQAGKVFQTVIQHLLCHYRGNNHGYTGGITDRDYRFNSIRETGYIIVKGQVENTVLKHSIARDTKSTRFVIIDNEEFITNEEYKNQTFESIDNYLRNIQNFDVSAQENAQAIIDDIDSFINSIPDGISETERETLIKIRVGQGVFRQRLLNYWNNSCSVTGCRMPNVLIASHIKPWRNCDDANEKLDVMNGLLLIPNLDALFDKGFISFDDDGQIIISPQLSEDDQERLSVSEDMELRETLSERHKIYLEYHRENIFQE